MHIKNLQLINFRGASNLSFDLHPQLNVFVGVNGAGKTTTLDATAKLLSWLANRIKTQGASGRSIVESSIRNGSSVAEIGITMNHADNEYSWSLVKGKRGYGKTKGSSLKGASSLAEYFQVKIAESDAKTNIPLFAYYPINRAVLDIPLRIRATHKFDLLSAYEESLTSGANFRTFFEWFRLREDIENEVFVETVKAFTDKGAEQGRSNVRDSQLDAVRTAIMRFIPTFEKISVRRQPLRMEVTKDGEVFSVDQLSDGEKCLMAMIGDIARRLAIANPESSTPLDGEGIILIDEIDLHLHPKWQSILIPRLVEVFPNCQFIISTHSPHVINRVKPESLFLMSMDIDGLKVNKASESYGKTVERVLEDVMQLSGTRPVEIRQELAKIFDSISLSNPKDSVLKAISSLRDKIGEDPELVRAEALLRRRELLGK